MRWKPFARSISNCLWNSMSYIFLLAVVDHTKPSRQEQRPWCDLNIPWYATRLRDPLPQCYSRWISLPSWLWCKSLSLYPPNSSLQVFLSLNSIMGVTCIVGVRLNTTLGTTDLWGCFLSFRVVLPGLIGMLSLFHYIGMWYKYKRFQELVKRNPKYKKLGPLKFLIITSLIH